MRPALKPCDIADVEDPTPQALVHLLFKDIFPRAKVDSSMEASRRLRSDPAVRKVISRCGRRVR